MSQINHLRRAVYILRNAFAEEIAEDKEWSYNLKNWTIQICVSEEDIETVCAYKVINNSTDWSNWIILEMNMGKSDDAKPNMSMRSMIDLLIENDTERFQNDPDDCLHNWLYMREEGWDGYNSWGVYDLHEELTKRGLLKGKTNV